MQFGMIFRMSKAALLAASLLGLSGCLSSKAKDDTYALSASTEVAGPGAGRKQILVPMPSALKALDSEQIVIRVTDAEIQYLGGARWGDSLPKMVQAKLVESYENSGRFGGVGKPGEGLAIDFQIVTDIRAFQIEMSGGQHAYVAVSVKLLNDRNGSVRAQRVFSAKVPVGGTGNDDFVRALDSAFARVSADIVTWTLKSV